MADPGFEIRATGPLFDADLPQNLVEAANRGLLELATIEGSNNVKDQLYPGHGRITGNLRNHVGADLVDDLVAQIDAGRNRFGANLVYSSWVEGISDRNQRSRFKGYHMFENTYRRINSNASKLAEQYIGERIVEALS
tara:strand:+ start:482 stop:895 length:414 start_codon:yes stop_codon:yes gene_type:complete